MRPVRSTLASATGSPSPTGEPPATVVLDAPVVINSSELEAVWRPINYGGRFYGPTRMREALVRSMNLVSVRLLLFETGIGNAVRHIANFGFNDAALPRNGSLALGGGKVFLADFIAPKRGERTPDVAIQALDVKTGKSRVILTETSAFIFSQMRGGAGK